MTNNLLRSYMKLTLLLVLILTANYSFASTESVDCDLSCNKKIISNKFKSGMPLPILKDFSNILALSEDELNYHIIKGAIYTDNASLVDELFKFGISANLTTNRWKRTFLMLAARRAQPNMIQIILNHGGQPNLGDKDGLVAIEHLDFSLSVRIDRYKSKDKKINEKLLLRHKNIPVVIELLLPLTTTLDPQFSTYISSFAKNYSDEKATLIKNYLACKRNEDLFKPYEDIQKLIAKRVEQVKSKTATINLIQSLFENNISKDLIDKANLNNEKLIKALSNINDVAKSDNVRFYAYLYQLDDTWSDFNRSFTSLEREVAKEVRTVLKSIQKDDLLTSHQRDDKFKKVSSLAITPKIMQEIIEFYANRKDWAKADLVLDKYIKYIKANNTHELGSLFTKLSRTYESNKNYTDQIQIENKRLSLIINIEGESSENLTPSYKNIGYANYRLKEYDNAINSYQKAIELTTEAESKISLYTQMGWVYGANKNYIERVNVEKKRIAAITELEGENSMRLASSYENIAYGKYRLDDNTSAIHFYEKALTLRIKPENKAKIYKHLGWAHKSNKSYDKLMDAIVKRYEMLIDESNKTSNDELDTFYTDFLDALPKVELANQKIHFARILRLTESQSERIKLFKKGEYKVSWVDNPETYVFIMELYISELTDNKLPLRDNFKDLNLLSLGNAYSKIGNEKLALKYLTLNYEYAENKDRESWIIYGKYAESLTERMKCIKDIKPNNALLDHHDDIELEQCMKSEWKYVYGKVIEQLKIDSKKYKEMFSINRRIRNLDIAQHNIKFNILNRKYASVKASLSQSPDGNKASHSEFVEIDKKLENFFNYLLEYEYWRSQSTLKDNEKIKKDLSDYDQSYFTLKAFFYDKNKLRVKS